MSKISNIRITVIAAVVAILIAASPANASQGTVSDPRGDAPRHFDIRTAGFSVSPGKLKATIKIPDLGKSGTVALVYSQPNEDWDDYQAFALLTRRAGKTSARVFMSSYAVDSHYELDCAASGRWDRRKGQVHVTVRRTKDCTLGSDPVLMSAVTARKATQTYVDFNFADETDTKKLPNS